MVKMCQRCNKIVYYKGKTALPHECIKITKPKGERRTHAQVVIDHMKASQIYTLPSDQDLIERIERNEPLS